jgi:hypothetical protein
VRIADRRLEIIAGGIWPFVAEQIALAWSNQFPAGDEASWGNPIPTCYFEAGRFGLAREGMAMRDPSLVVSKADIRQQTIKGREVPIASFRTAKGS